MGIIATMSRPSILALQMLQRGESGISDHVQIRSSKLTLPDTTETPHDQRHFAASLVARRSIHIRKSCNRVHLLCPCPSSYSLNNLRPSEEAVPLLLPPCSIAEPACHCIRMFHLFHILRHNFIFFGSQRRKFSRPISFHYLNPTEIFVSFTKVS